MERRIRRSAGETSEKPVFVILQICIYESGKQEVDSNKDDDFVVWIRCRYKRRVSWLSLSYFIIHLSNFFLVSAFIKGAKNVPTPSTPHINQTLILELWMNAWKKFWKISSHRGEWRKNANLLTLWNLKWCNPCALQVNRWDYLQHKYV